MRSGGFTRVILEREILLKHGALPEKLNAIARDLLVWVIHALEPSATGKSGGGHNALIV
jgi:hypothetical protein